MKKILLLTFISLLSLGFTKADVLNTKSFKITITSNCEEGIVSCDDIDYVGVSKKNGNSIKLKGRDIHNICADEVTPCRFLGYKFKNGNVIYWVLGDGTLEVIKGSKVLLTEKGEWDY